MIRRKGTLITFLALIALTAVLGAAPALGGGKGQVVSVFGEVPGTDLIVHAWVLVPPGADKNEAAAHALAQQGARPIDADAFSTTGLLWDQFSDSDPYNDFVTQNYNPANDPLGNGEAILLRTHATWSTVATSTFAFKYGGQTNRCPSLVRECPGKQFGDGFHDVGWMDIKGCCTLGVTWFNTSTKEADMALNTKFSWADDGATDFDAETVTLHENGHVGGLGHSNVPGAVMEASYVEVRGGLHQDDIDGITSLYSAPGPTGSISGTVTDATNGLVIASATVSTDTGQSAEAVDGTYTLTGVPTGTTTVTGSAIGYQSSSTTDVVDEDQTTTGVNLYLVPAPSGTTASVDSITYFLSGGRNNDKHLTVAVHVSDDLGGDLPGASVAIRLKHDSGQTWTGTGTTGTDGTVTFVLSNARKGCYDTDVTDVTADGLDWDGLPPANGFCK